MKSFKLFPNTVKKTTLLFLMVILSYVVSEAQNIWRDIQESTISTRNNERQIIPQNYRTVFLDLPKLKRRLLTVPNEKTSRTSPARFSFTMEFPMPDGTSQDFYVMESSIMEPDLAEAYPGIKTYLAQGIDDPTASMRFDITPKGFHAMITSAGKTTFIDPYNKNNTSDYIVYRKKDFQTDKSFSCGVQSHPSESSEASGRNALSNGTNLREYRLAVAATGEYTAFHGGTVADGLAAIVTTINRVNQVYENDLAIRFILVANNNLLIYTDGATDPFDNNDAGTLINQSQTEIDNTIGNANYDIGHTVSTGGGGLAGLGVVCRVGQKGRGITGSGNPIGDPYDIDYVSHEIGHQFGGNHTFNGSSGSCGGNISGKSYEPGSGSTIQAYAGICAPQNLQSNSDPYFHIASLEEMITYSTSGSGNNCPNIIATNNTPPVASVPMAVGLTIPINTPFELEGAAMDADGDALTYCWEQYDLGPAGAPESPTGNAPLFRSWSPDTNPVRTFPRLSDLLNNTIAYGEILPSYTRSMNYRLTVRDNRAGGGGVHCAAYAVDVDDSAGPFLMTAPNASGIVWPVGGSETVTWDVAGTTAAPISCANVDILLSTDGGNTYSTILASGVPNSGSATIAVPNTPSATVRIKVKCADNIFFDISNQNLEIQVTGPDFSLEATPPAQSICEGNDAVYNVNVNTFGGFTGSVTLSVTGLPAGATAVFSTNPVVGTGTSILTITTTGVAMSASTISITGNGTPGTKNITAGLQVFDDAPSTVSLASPANGQRNVSISHTFSWNAMASAETYDLEIATDVGFASIVESATALTANSYTTPASLNNKTIYYWRVRANNICGSGSWSSVYAFETERALPCSNEISEGGFEAGTGSAWSESSTSGYQLVDNSSGNYNSGAYSAWLGGDDNEDSQVWQTVVISPTVVSASLSYYYAIISSEAAGDCALDYGYVKINGVTETTYGLCSDNNSAGFQQAIIDLAAYVGTTVEIRFQCVTNGGNISSFFIDDVVLDICESTVASCDPPFAIATEEGTYTADMECTDATGWTHYWKTAGMAPVTSSDLLLLSVKKDAAVDISPSQVSVGVTGVGGSVDLSSAPYVTDPVGWFVMNRYWNVNPTVQPGALGVDVRFYYTAADYEGVNTAVTGSGGTAIGQTDLVFYKFQTGSAVDPNPTNGHTAGNSGNYLELASTYATYITDHRAEFNVTGFSGGGGGAGGAGGGALPVELLSFTAKKDGNYSKLHWKTASEQNNEGFHVGRSGDGRNFDRIGFVNGAGTTSEIQQYGFVDQQPLNGVNYYRLTQIDWDGSEIISNVETVLFDEIFHLSVYPNPTRENHCIALDIITENTQKINIELFDVSGKRIYDLQYKLDQGRNIVTLPDLQLSTGVYMVSVIHENGKDNLKLSVMD